MSDTTTYDAEWCTALAPTRAALERARDARAGKLGDPAVTERFSLALQALQSEEDTHRAATGCDKRH